MHPPFDITAEDTEAVLRRASELSAAHSDGLDDLDLRQSYDDAVDCVFKCESIIVNLERQLKAKDERIAELEAAAGSGPSAREELDAKDERIAGLEEKLVSMSLELASTKASEDRLQLKLTQSNSSLSALAASAASTQSPSLSRRYLPVSNAGARDRGGWGCLSRWGNGREVVESDEGSDEANKESFTTEATAESTDVDEAADKGDEGDVKIDNGKLEKFLEMMTGRKDEGVRFAEAPAEAPPSEPRLAPPPPPPHGEAQAPSDSGGRRQRRAPGRRRRELQKSSRSFLENRGVVFPVSSFEVLDKGCATAGAIEKRGANDVCAGSNEDWPAMG
ncbi:hypothetical protein ACHAWF_005919 [Thalassiosira exigua]